MAIVDRITGENIERFRGIIDFYLLRGRLPVARKWPKKPKPPYTVLQAEAMAVFALANVTLKRLSDDILSQWRIGSTGVRPSWTDTFRGIIMKYWKLNRTICPIALDYTLTETETEYKITWQILQLYLDLETPETITDLAEITITKISLEDRIKPIYFTLYDDVGSRVCAPNILLVGE